MSDIRAEARRDAEFDRLLAERMSEQYVDYTAYDMQAAHELGKRHKAEEGPAWHDAPTCAGIWVAQKEFAHTLHLSEGFEPLDAWKNYRWFGPIKEECGAYTGIREVSKRVATASGTDEVEA